MNKSATFRLVTHKNNKMKKIRGNYDLMYEGEIFEMNHSTRFWQHKRTEIGSK